MNEFVTGIVKWALVVLGAGFIGYFGRYLAMIIIRRVRKEKPESKNITIKTEPDEEKYKYKLEKKRLKFEKKKLKEKN